MKCCKKGAVQWERGQLLSRLRTDTRTRGHNGDCNILAVRFSQNTSPVFGSLSLFVLQTRMVKMTEAVKHGQASKTWLDVF